MNELFPEQDILVVYRGMGINEEDVPNILKNGFLSSGYHFFGDSLTEIVKKYENIDLGEATLEDLIKIQDATNPFFEQKHPGKNYMPMVSTSSDLYYAAAWARNNNDKPADGYLFRLVVPKSKTAITTKDIKADTVIFANIDNQNDVNIENEWLSNGSRISPKYIAGFWDMRTGRYVPNGDHPFNVGFNPQPIWAVIEANELRHLNFMRSINPDFGRK